MAIITLPSAFSFTAIKKFSLLKNGNTLRSRYNAARQYAEYPYAIWVFEATLVEYQGDEAAAIRSFFVQLEGQKNSFRLPVPGYSRSATGYTGNATINGAVAARASSFAVDGLTPSAAIIKDGEYFTVNDELKMCIGNIAANGSGQATISFKPPMRTAIVDNATVYLQDPWMLLNAQKDDVADWGISPPYRHKLEIEAIENIQI